MTLVTRLKENPILLPDPSHDWEAAGAFNGCVLKEGGKYHMVYRAMSKPQEYRGVHLQMSVIGHAESADGIHFINRRKLIEPQEPLDTFGCEDPRITKFEGKYYIFYTTLPEFPYSAANIKIGVAITDDLKTIKERYPVTTFNAKAMALFPKRINGKMAALLTADTDTKPSKIALAVFDKESDIWSPEYWNRWYAELDQHVLPLMRSMDDQVELGAPPIETKEGWLVLYSHIKNYRTGRNTVFGIEAVLLDKKDPRKILGRTLGTLLIPQEDYELMGNVAHIVFPSGAAIDGDKLLIYYGAADTSCAVATVNLKKLIREMLHPEHVPATVRTYDRRKLTRFEENPILSPIPEHAWESRAVFNPSAIYAGGKAHLVYRAMSEDNTSVMGYAAGTDGLHFDERLPSPIYGPRADFERKGHPGGNSGCEDPRLTLIGDAVFMCYTAYTGLGPPRVAITSISLKDFLAHRWTWTVPALISPPDRDDKDACLLPKKILDRYVIFHRLNTEIFVDFARDPFSPENKWLGGVIIMGPRKNSWDNEKIGIAAPPIETKAGWLFLYHGVSQTEHVYRVGAGLLDLNNPTKLLARTDYPILEPEIFYEEEGEVEHVVFPGGTVIIKNTLYVYYGGADKVVGVATMPVKALLDSLV